MKRTKHFFLRLDIFRKASYVLVLFFVLLIYFTSSMKADAVRTVFLFSGAAIFAIGCTVRTPKAEEITDHLSKHHAEFEKAVIKEHKIYRDNAYVALYAFDREKARLARTVGNRLLYPVCLNMLFAKHAEGTFLTVENFSLYNIREPKLTTLSFGKKETFSIRILRLDGDAEMMLVTLVEGEEEKLTFFARDDHQWKQFLNYIQSAATVTEVTA